MLYTEVKNNEVEIKMNKKLAEKLVRTKNYLEGLAYFAQALMELQEVLKDEDEDDRDADIRYAFNEAIEKMWNYSYSNNNSWSDNLLRIETAMQCAMEW